MLVRDRSHYRSESWASSSGPWLEANQPSLGAILYRLQKVAILYRLQERAITLYVEVIVDEWIACQACIYLFTSVLKQKKNNKQKLCTENANSSYVFFTDTFASRLHINHQMQFFFFHSLKMYDMTNPKA